MFSFSRGRRATDSSQEQSNNAPASPVHRRYKKLAYTSALVLSVFAVPLAVQALSDGDSDKSADTQHGVQAGEQAGAGVSGSQSNQSQTTVDVSTPPAANTGGSSSASLTVNGQDVPIPSNGSVHKQINHNSGQTTVDVYIEDHQSGSGNVYSSSSTDIDINSHSYSSGSQNDSEGRHPPRR